MGTFYADPAVGGSGVTHDEADWDDYGYTDPDTGLFAAFNNMLAISQDAADSATAAAASALTAVNAPGTSATSTTSNTIASSGSKTWTIQTGKAFAVNQYVVVGDSTGAANYMLGRITAHNPTTGSITVAIASSQGSGTLTAWTIALAIDPAGAVSSARTLTAAGLVTGGGDLSADRTFTVTAAVDTDIWAASSAAKAVTPDALKDAAAFIALSDGATVTPDGDAGFNFTWTIGGNRTMANPSNFKVGQRGSIIITQDGTGGRTLTRGSYWKVPGGTLTLSTAAGAVDQLDYVVITSTRIHLTLVKAFS